MIIAFYTCLVIILVAASLFLIWPWVEESPKDLALRDKDNPLPKLQEYFQEKDFLIDHLKEIELDWQMGKLNEDDYQRLKNDLLQSSLDLEKELQDFESQSKVLQEIEQAKAALS